MKTKVCVAVCMMLFAVERALSQIRIVCFIVCCLSVYCCLHPSHSFSILSIDISLSPSLPLSPNYDLALSTQLTKFYGSINEETTVHDILPTVQTGDLHIAFYDLTANNLFVSFMRKEDADPSEPHYAYERQFTKLNTKLLFDVSL
jgi:hypothetical protein